MSNKLPVDQPSFWKGRILNTIAHGHDLHKAIYDIDLSVWQEIQATCKGVLQRHIQSGQKVLDAGCGMGSMYSLFPTGVEYTGIDISPDLIDIAWTRYPEGMFRWGDLTEIDYASRSFNWAVCRSVERMVCDNLGVGVWRAMYAELQRVAVSVMLIDYGDTYYTVTTEGVVTRLDI